MQNPDTYTQNEIYALLPRKFVDFSEYRRLEVENSALKAELSAVKDNLEALQLFATNLDATHRATLREMQITMRQEITAAHSAGMLAAAEIAADSGEFELADAIREAAKS